MRHDLEVLDEMEMPDAGKPNVMDILAADNALDLLTEAEATRIGTTCLQGFEDDLASRNSASDDGNDWEKRYDRYLDIPCRCARPSRSRGRARATSSSRC